MAVLPPPVGNWKFDGNANDSSSYGNNAIVYGPVYTSGVSGQALYFDGIDDYVQINSAAQLTFSKTSNFSISLWFKQENPGVYDALIGSSNVANFTYNYIYIYSFSNGPMVLLNIEAADNTGNCMIHNYGSVDSNWHHVVVTHSSNTILLYFDGVLRQGYPNNNANSNLSDSYNVSAPWGLGKLIGQYPAQDRFFKGCIDEVRYFRYTYDDAILEDELYRFLPYSSWASGGQGMMIWSYPHPDAKKWFPLCHQIAREAYAMKDYIMNEPALDIPVYMTVDNGAGDPNNGRFILRRNQNNPTSNEFLLLFCYFGNQGGSHSSEIHFPYHTITNVRQITTHKT